MLVELHSLTSHAPANLNRDDLGRPKSAVFGGTQRARISSQAIKRSIRTSNYLEGLLAGRLSTRSRQIPQMIYDNLENNGLDLDRLQKVCEVFTEVIGKPDKNNKLHTSQIVFLTAGEIERVTDYIARTAGGDAKLDSKGLKELKETAAVEIGLSRNPGDGVDMALFGRMTTDDEEKFAAVDAAMQVAHAISTHTVTPEVDWFTAVDDIVTGSEQTGSGHLGETEFNSAVFYKYFSCNLPLLARNLKGETATAIDALAAVFDAACRVTPSGKQNSFASHALADTVLIVLRDARIPVSLANSFERPVGRDASSESGYLDESRNRMLKHYGKMRAGYELNDRAVLFTTAENVEVEGVESVATLGEALAWMRRHLESGVGEHS